MNRSVEQRLLDLYVANVDIVGEGFSVGLNSQRREYIEAFNLAGIPDRKDERYGLSDLRTLFDSREWEHYFTPVQLSALGGESLPSSRYRIEVNNGFCTETELCRLENGVVYGSLRTALQEEVDSARLHYNTVADNKGASLTALNSAFMQDGSFVYVPEGVELDEPILVFHRYGAGAEDVMGFGRTLLVFGAGCRARVQLIHAGDHGEGVDDRGSYLADYVREICVGEGADVHLSEVSDFSGNCHLLLESYVSQETRSRCEIHTVDLGEGTARLDYTTDLTGREAESYLYGLYLHGERERCDVGVTVNHLVPECRSYEMVKGVASGEATGSFTGRVYVAQDAQHTDAFQQSRNLLLSPEAHIYTRPQLEIYADDVKCSHGATVGQLDAEAIYYMRQRGIGEDEARRLQLHGFVNDVISHCCCESFCDWMTARAERKIATI